MKNIFKTILVIVAIILITYLFGSTIIVLFPNLVIHTRYGGIIVNPIIKSFYLGIIVDVIVLIFVTIYSFVSEKL